MKSPIIVAVLGGAMLGSSSWVSDLTAQTNASDATVTRAADETVDLTDTSETNAAVDDSTTAEGESPRRAEDDSPRRSMQRRFDRSSPAIGEPLPDVTAYDADGNRLNLADLKGQYSVIVFGCLT